MKKSLLLLFFLAISIASFSSIEWKPLSVPFGTAHILKITANDQIWAVDGNTLYISSDLGGSWDSYPIPYNVGATSNRGSVFFSGRLYVLAENGIVSTSDGSDWIMNKSGYSYRNMTADNMYVYATGQGHFYRSSNGVEWESMAQPIATVDVCSADDEALYFGCQSSTNKSQVFRSITHGKFWEAVSEFEIANLMDLTTVDGDYDAVGYTFPEENLASYGIVSFTADSGNLRCVTHFNGQILTGGMKKTSPGHYVGLIIPDGDVSAADTFPSEVGVLVSSQNYCLAYTCDGIIYYTDNFPAGTGQIEGISFSVYPNPATTTTTVSTRMSGQYGLYDLSGRQIGHYVLKSGDNTLDVSGLKPGMYLLSDGKSTLRLIKR